MALARVEELGGRLREREHSADLSLGSPTNPRFRPRALRACERSVGPTAACAFVCSLRDRGADEIIHHSTLASNGL